MIPGLFYMYFINKKINKSAKKLKNKWSYKMVDLKDGYGNKLKYVHVINKKHGRI